MDSSDRDDAVTCAGTGDPFQQPWQALGLPGFSGAGLNSTGTGRRIADGWYTSDADGVGAQTRTGTKRPAADPRPAGDGLPGELGVDAGYGPSGMSSYGESPSPTDILIGAFGVISQNQKHNALNANLYFSDYTCRICLSYIYETVLTFPFWSALTTAALDIDSSSRKTVSVVHASRALRRSCLRHPLWTKPFALFAFGGAVAGPWRDAPGRGRLLYLAPTPCRTQS